ncbi:hypothetical protein CERSUDRAFT_92353 [Gelatoporia subvermispora B]|uniref:Uncharacterized protein n=1 Tax=Ceriporiopsis subvermispora (strain B) TaxID=914234 RepID=M2RLX3_CERS8|nr:hypothetical protein CERSUDRAFT_92353 [Gelatoporia subvermispora B]
MSHRRGQYRLRSKSTAGRYTARSPAGMRQVSGTRRKKVVLAGRRTTWGKHGRAVPSTKGMRVTGQGRGSDAEQRFQQEAIRVTVQRHGGDTEQRFQQEAMRVTVQRYGGDTEQRFQQQATRFLAQRHGGDMEQRFQRQAM